RMSSPRLSKARPTFVPIWPLDPVMSTRIVCFACIAADAMRPSAICRWRGGGRREYAGRIGERLSLAGFDAVRAPLIADVKNGARGVCAAPWKKRKKGEMPEIQSRAGCVVLWGVSRRRAFRPRGRAEAAV